MSTRQREKAYASDYVHLFNVYYIFLNHTWRCSIYFVHDMLVLQNFPCVFPPDTQRVSCCCKHLNFVGSSDLFIDVFFSLSLSPLDTLVYTLLFVSAYVSGAVPPWKLATSQIFPCTTNLTLRNLISEDSTKFLLSPGFL